MNDGLALDSIHGGFVTDALCEILGLQIGMSSILDPDLDVDGRAFFGPLEQSAAGQVVPDGFRRSPVFAIPQRKLFALKDASCSHIVGWIISYWKC